MVNLFDIYWWKNLVINVIFKVGTNCETSISTPISVCQQNPCLNGGSCSTSSGSSSYVCNCLSNYSGTNCANYTPTQLTCSTNLCLNNGLCNTFNNGTTACLCLRKYYIFLNIFINQFFYVFLYSWFHWTILSTNFIIIK